MLSHEQANVVRPVSKLLLSLSPFSVAEEGNRETRLV